KSIWRITHAVRDLYVVRKIDVHLRCPCSTTQFIFFFTCSPTLADLHSFPTRRSSDLFPVRGPARAGPRARSEPREPEAPEHSRRSEEHTSELQSRGHLVCRLLLEKKKPRASRRNRSSRRLARSHFPSDCHDPPGTAAV